MNTPRYQHLRFHELKTGEEFFTKKFRYYKSGFFTGRAILDGELIVVMPWTRVRSARPFGKVKDVRPPQKVEGGDKSSETIGGSELTPSS